MSRKRRDKAIVYVGHIPFGLFEPQLREYFSQFGKIRRLKLSRSKKNGHSRGYAFIEFDSLEVAKIAASTMNNYIIFKRSLKCHVIPEDKVHPFIFNRSKKQKNVTKSSDNLGNKKSGSTFKSDRETRIKEKILKINDSLRKSGIEYAIPV
ncbi:mki67 (FHA domain) interacting nucleolar phosphoprotein [Cryptosporidium ryanae]|uniref:mki67 (FHA domain) interacting nucleolar phosphoprotein n=1 Tax=Cryptosporidium ryanae TaxID=515981 RepID=UPI00351A3C22|nr:mki67 (FHA domain) interacting nucleolar phosphoprotein [Cryptosporidium ryanae]